MTTRTVGHHIQAAIEPVDTKPTATIRRFTRNDSLRRTVDQHTRLWKYYDHIPEIHYWVGVASNITRMLHYFPGIIRNDVDTREPEPDTDPDVRALWDDIGGEERMRELVSELVAHRRVAGEAYMVPVSPDGILIDPNDPDTVSDDVTWDVVSSIELRRMVGLETGTLADIDVPAWRIWKRHWMDAHRSDPPLASVAQQCEALLALDGRILADSRARLSAGILFLPDSLLTVRTPSGRSFDEELDDAIMTPIRTADSPDSVSPLRAYAQPDEINTVKHVTFGRENINDAVTQREELIRRIAAGMDAPAELLLGMGDLNHWSAWLIQDSTYTQHIDPDVVDVLDDLSVWWRSMLESAGINPDGRVLWRDPNPALRRPDRLNDVITVFDRYAASEESLRDAAGLDENDAPTNDEIERRLRYAQMERSGTIDVIDEPGPPNSDNPSDGDTPPEMASRRVHVIVADGTERLTRLAHNLDFVDRQTIGVIDREAERAIRRARARAVDRVISEAQTLPAYDIGVTGRRLFDALTPDQVRAIAGDNAAVDIDDIDITPIVAAMTSAETLRTQALQRDGVDTGDTNADDDIEAGASIIRAALFAAAVQAVLGARPDPDRQGETPDADIIVPMTDIRRGLTVAGGTPAASITPVAADDTQLIGNGQRTIDDLARAGLRTVAYEWVYGDIPRNPFEPHRAMNNRQFESFTDDTLTPPMEAAWLGSRMYPGDHKGCRCTYRRVLEQVAV